MRDSFEWGEGEVAGGVSFLEVGLRGLGAVFLADELGAVSKTGESFGGGGSVAVGIAPLSNTVVVAMADEASPE